jgi:CRISPR-associated protein Cmr2
VAYLPKWGFEKEHFKMPNTPGIADHDPNAEQNPDLHDEDLAPAEDKISELLTRRTYFAVLAFDGDNMGKHLRCLDSDVKHTRFSKELGEFALNKVRPVVESHDGRVIYAGGDDVLALLPADTALPCAEALQKVFHATTGQHASAGIAIAHYKNPLQDVVRAAQAAEKRAKQKLGRAAVAITLLKRSGETVEWGCQWSGGGLELFKAIADALRDEKLSAKFTYALVELLQPYLTAGTPLMKARAREKPAEPVAAFAAATVIRRDFDYVLGRQRGPEFPKEEEEPENFAKQLTAAMGQYLEHLGTRYPDDTESQLQEVIGLFRTVSFAPAQFNQRLVRPSPGYGPTSTSSATKK